jgi:pimeloyl-ACP methyl ester carboxylesterase
VNRTLEVDGARIAWTDSGAGVPVVFVHGVITDRRTWLAQEDAVASRYRFVAVDLRHHGQSERVGAYRLAQHGEDLKAVLRTLAAPRAVLVGHSFGASVVVSLLLQEPQLAAGAVLVEPALDGALPKDASVLDLLTERNKRFKAAIAALTQHGDDAAMRTLAEWTDNGHVGRWDLVEPEYLAMLKDNAHTFRLLLGTVNETASMGRDRLRSIETPTLVVNGAETQRYFAEVGRATAEVMANARHVVLAGASHAVPSHNSSEFNSALLGFVERVLKAATTQGDQRQ